MGGEQENPGEAGKIPEKEKLEKLVYHARAVSQHIQDGDYISAAFVMDNFPEGYNKSDFFRFDDTSEGVYGVLYSGLKVRADKKEVKKPVIREKGTSYSNPWPDRSGWLRIFGGEK